MEKFELENAIRVLNKLDRNSYLKSDSSPALSQKGLFKTIKMEEKILKEQKALNLDGKVSICLPIKNLSKAQEILIKKLKMAYNDEENIFINSPYNIGTSTCLLSALLGCIKSERDSKVNSGFYEAPRMIYVAQTMERLEQISIKLKQLAYRPTICIYNPKEKACQRFPDEHRQDEVEVLCLESRSTDSCPFFKNLNDFELNNKDMESVNDIEDFNNYCSNNSICQYYYSLDYANLSDVFLITFDNFLDRLGFQGLELNINNAVIVIDDASSLDTRAEKGHSAEIDMEWDLKKAYEQLEYFNTNLYELFRHRGEENIFNQKNLEDLSSLISNLISQFKKTYIGKLLSERVSRLDKRSDEIEYSVFPFWKKQAEYSDQTLVAYLKRMLKILGFVISKLEINENFGLCRLYRFMELSLFLVEESESQSYIKENYALTFYVDADSEGKFRHMMSLQCLTAYPFFHQIKSCKSIVFRSHDMSKVFFMQRDYGIKIKYDFEFKNHECRQNESESPNANSKVSHLKNADYQVQFFTQLKNDIEGNPINIMETKSSRKAIDALGLTIIKLLRHMTGGILVLFPNVDTMKFFFLEWKKASVGLIEEIESIREVILYDKAKSAKMLGLFQEHSKISGAVLFASICQGILEALQAKENIVNGLILFGDSYYSSSQSILLKLEIKNLLDKRNDKRNGSGMSYSGNDWENNQKTKFFNKLLGTFLRRPTDMRHVFLLDSKFSRETKLVEWFPKLLVFPSYIECHKSLLTFNNIQIDYLSELKGEKPQRYIQTFNLTEKNSKSMLVKGLQIKTPFTEEQESNLRHLFNIGIESLNEIEPVEPKDPVKVENGNSEINNKIYKAVLLDSEDWEVAIISKRGNNKDKNKEIEISNNLIECGLCFGSSSNFKANYCGHVACNDCWDATLNVNLICPYCRRSARKASLFSIFLQKKS